MNIALAIVSTGKYKIFLNNLIKTADQYFLTNHNVTYHLFVDELVEIPSNRKIVQHLIEHKPWPAPTLFKYKNLMSIKKELDNLDYIYMMDSDTILENPVGDEILDDIVCVVHNGYIGNRGTPEKNPKSLAYVADSLNFQYMGGAFLGGSKDCFLNMVEFLANQIDIDYKRGIIAEWHEESHANKFFILYATKILSPEYYYNKDKKECTENKNWTPRIVQAEKKQSKIRDY